MIWVFFFKEMFLNVATKDGEGNEPNNEVSSC